MIVRAATAVATEVSEAVADLDGSQRIVEAIVASVRAVRVSPALHAWFALCDTTMLHENPPD
ncbi:hypothetical protein FK531_10910 [Rhodococcus spelaei]|uniref:Uncharacterized protein n=1 Tax=Rhodococcus spelaei TaxID=2546320 RepID=A0A541BA89_9NOCA|nr:hypothetical protein [Rhodococcus spelaei]TQF69246.1 hypothetical protein FK531_10910 [Rhodococcus spelaei]